MRVLSFGEILFDIIEGEPYLGGAPLNFAAHLAECGAESYIFSRVGEDDLGRQAVAKIKALGVKTDLIQKDPQHPTGTVEVILDKGQPDFVIHENVAWDFIEAEEAEEFFEDAEFDILYFGTLAQRHLTSRETLMDLLMGAQVDKIFYDVNLRKGYYSREILHNSVGLCHILKLNDDEVKVLSFLLFEEEMEMAEFTQTVVEEYEVETIIITAGDKGCYVYDGDELIFVKGYPAQVQDTVGAGDAFSAAFVYRYFYTQDAQQSADVANRLGAFVASSRGPIPAYTDEIRKMLEVGNK